MPPRSAFFENQKETVSVKNSDQNQDTAPIHHERIEKDIREALNMLRFVGPDVRDEVVDDLKMSLQKIQVKYEKLCTDRDGSLKDMEKELYSKLEPVLLKAAANRLKSCKNIENPDFEKDGLTFTFGKEKVKAVLNEDYEIESFQIGGVTFRYTESVTMEFFDQQFGQIALNVFRQVDDRFHPKNLEINVWQGRYNFSIQEQGAGRKFTATAQDLLEVKKEPDPLVGPRFLQQLKQFESASDGCARTIQKLRALFSAPGSPKPEVVKALDVFQDIENKAFTPESSDDFHEIQDLDTKNFSPGQLDAWKIFLQEISALLYLKTVTRRSKKEANTRILEGVGPDGKPFKVEEDVGWPTPNWFSWKYLDEKGQKTKSYNFKNGSLDYAEKIENGEEHRFFFERGRIVKERNETKQYEDLFDQYGVRLGREFDAPDGVKKAMLFDKAGVLLDSKVLNQMPLAQLQTLLLDLLGRKDLVENNSKVLCRAIWTSADAIKNCPKAKEIFLKAARLQPGIALWRYGWYKDMLYAWDSVVEAAHQLHPASVAGVMNQVPALKSLSKVQRSTLFMRTSSDTTAVDFAKSYLREDNPENKIDLEIDETSPGMISYGIAEFLGDRALSFLKKFPEKWLQPLWNTIQIPESANSELNEKVFQQGIRLMIIRNLLAERKDMTMKNVQEEFFQIFEDRKMAQDVPLFQGKNIVLASHNELIRDNIDLNDLNDSFNRQLVDYYEQTSKDVHRFGKKGLQDALKVQQGGSGSFEFIRDDKRTRESIRNAKDAFLNAIRTTSPPATFVVNTHGDGLQKTAIFLSEDFYDERGKIVDNPTPSQLKEISISSDEIAEAYLQRLEKFPQLNTDDLHKKDIFILSNCFNFNLVLQIVKRLGNKPKPIFLGESEYAQPGISNLASKVGKDFFHSVLQLDPDSPPPAQSTNLGFVMDQELFQHHTLPWEQPSLHGNLSLFIPRKGNQSVQIAENETGRQKPQNSRMKKAKEKLV